MKQLWLLRHASAENGAPDGARPLSARGRDEARSVGERWGGAEDSPELILTSAARRARETTELVAETLSAERRVEESLYLAGPGAILQAIAAVDPHWNRLLVVGHNPGLADLAAALAGTSSEAARRLHQVGFAPAALATFELDVEDWSETDGPWARLVDFQSP